MSTDEIDPSKRMRRFRQPMGPARKVTRSATSNSPSETRKGGPNGGRPPNVRQCQFRTSVQEMHEDGNADQARGSHAQRHQFKMQSHWSSSCWSSAPVQRGNVYSGARRGLLFRANLLLCVDKAREL